MGDVFDAWEAGSRTGNHSAAIQLKERANREALLVADHAGTEELKEIFLSRPDVQKVLVS